MPWCSQLGAERSLAIGALAKPERPYAKGGDRILQFPNVVAGAGYRGGIHGWGGAYSTPSKRWVEPRIEISGYVTLSQFAYKVRRATR